jgi:hypothetical protein
MTLFYRGPCALITHEVLQVRCPYYRSFAIRELQYVHAVRNRTSRRAGGADPRVVCSTALAGAATIVATAGIEAGSHPVLPIVAVIAGVASAVTGVCARGRGRTHQIWGYYRGRLECLFLTRDRQTFDQVSRALVRVLERLEDNH